MNITMVQRFVSIAACVGLLASIATGIASAGTTGGISGVVVDATSGAPVAATRVTAASPSQTATSTTDAGGHFAFVSLVPDEYTVSAEHADYDTASISGVSVFADATQVVRVTLHRTLKTIANVRSLSSASLVRPGTTADIYSINAAQQERTNVLGGGGNLSSAYSAIAAVPGAYVPTNQSGYNQAVHVRGGDSSEVGYEFDGIPINRGFDNYVGGGESSLGQLELQVYTGATPANAEAQGLAGFINQVIKTGTYPGYASASLSAGTPTFYHEANVEAGGSSPNRLFNYYVGLDGYNQDYRYIDQFNGGSYSNTFGPPVDQCQAPANLGASPPASCFTNGLPNVSAAGAPGYILAPMPFGYFPAASVQGRTTVVNLHFGIPHKYDDMRDDVQLLYDVNSITTPLYVSALDEGLNNFQGQLFYSIGTLPFYSDSYQFLGQPATFLNDASAAQVTPYLFPSSPANRALFAPIPPTARDQQFNNQDIVKLQYQKNFRSGYLRLYGYTYYSDYIGTGAVSSWQPLIGFDSNDYQVSSHTRGVSLQFAQQLGPQHLLQIGASYTTATSTRMNNTQMYDPGDAFAVVVNPNNLTHGVCYSVEDSSGAPLPPGPATATTCGSGNVLSVGIPATFASLANTFFSGPPEALTDESGNPIGSATLATYTCGGGPCALYTVENGQYGKYNTVKPNFSGFSISDEWRPNSNLLFNAGVRLDQYQFVGADTTATAARAFWFNAFNNDTCFDTQNLTLYDKTSLADGSSIPISSPCSAGGAQYINAALNNVPSQTFTYNILQPRIGATWTLSPQTVIRASAGKYNEQPSGAYEQYNALQQNLPDALVPFYALGFTTPGHEVRPPVSYNYDFSLEHQFKGTDMAMKITPFLRQTHDQIENFYLDIRQAFISGLNAGNQTSSGVEFAFTKGDFNRDGFAAQLGFTYTYAKLKFSTLPNGTTVLSPINADIRTYNAYTSFCAAHSSDPRCGATTTGVTAAPCYNPDGSPNSTCTAVLGVSPIANPYWNAPVQGLFDPNAEYLPYTIIPGGIGTGVNAYTYPYVASLILQYKHKKLTVTPSFQFVAGNRYGAPETMPGIDPAGGCAGIAGAATAGDPRYPYGASGGLPFDSATCAASLNAIPDSYTGHFDNFGEFREPSQLLMHLRLSYDFTPRITGTVTLANLISTCFGGQQTAFTYYWARNVCSYSTVGQGVVSPVGNIYNPGDNVQTILRYPYEPTFGTYNDLNNSILNPFSLYFNLRVKV